MVTTWSSSAAAYEYIKRDSPQNAIKVTNEIIDLTLELPASPEIYPIDKYKLNNDGTYRAFELHRYRISYRVLKDSIRIIRMRHTSRSPLSY